MQDDIKAGNATLQARPAARSLRRPDHDDAAAAAARRARTRCRAADTVLRASYGRTLETPYNENLLLSAGYGAERRCSATGRPLPPGHAQPGARSASSRARPLARRRLRLLQQAHDNGYDFGVLFDTPIVFPVAWDHSRIDGFTGRVNLVEHGGFSAFVVMAHTNAIFSPPGVGGILLEAARRRLPHRPRSEVQRDDEPAVHRSTRRTARGRRCQLAVRLGPRRRLGRQPRGRAGAHRRSAGGDRLLLRQHGRDARRRRSHRAAARRRTAARRGCRFRPRAPRTT